MTLIPVEEDKKTIADRFRKAHSFAFLDEGQIIVQENPHKTSKSPEFFDYFKTLNIDTLYVKELGYKTLLTLLEMIWYKKQTNGTVSSQMNCFY